MDKELYQTLVNQFAMYEKSEVLEVLNNSESSDEAIAACKYILSGKSKEVEQYNKTVAKENELLQKKQEDPSYENIKQIAGDIRFIRDIIIIGIVFEFINVIISLI